MVGAQSFISGYINEHDWQITKNVKFIQGV